MVDLNRMQKALLLSAKELIQRETELCQLDSFIGDGDHGTTIRKAFVNIIHAIENEKPTDISSLFMTSAMALSDGMGGAIGPIFAAIFLGFASSTAGKDALSTNDLAEMFQEALDQVQEIGGAKVGDKTLVDALSPAVDTLLLKASLELSEKEALTAAAESAHKGAEATAAMVSQKGRSHFLGVKSKGYIDAGSMSMYYFINGLAKAI